jgi:acetyl esterase
MSLDPKVQAMYAAAPPRATASLERGPRAVATAEALRRNNPAQGPLDFPGVDVTDSKLDVDGRTLGLRIYRPRSTGPFGALVNFHGGGWVMGNLALDDRRLARIAAEVGLVAIAVDYRLAPEDPFPAALEDGLAALRWAASGAGGLGIDAQRIAIGGSSSGANIAAALALIWRGEAAPPLRFQLLNYPVLDCALDWPSYGEFADGPGVTREMMAWYWDVYAGQAERSDPRMSPLRSDDLAGLPATLVVTAECDVLRDEAEAYAARLMEAHIPTVLTRYDGMPHGFLSLSIDLEQARSAVDLSIRHLRFHLA